MGRRVGILNNQIVAVIGEGVDPAPGMACLEVPTRFSHYSDEALLTQAKIRRGEVVVPGSYKDLSELRAVFVGVYGVPCGIATYSEALWPKMWSGIGDWRLFSEEAEGETAPDDPRVVKGLWKRGKSLSLLAEAIEEFAPDVVFIQHEYGIFPDAKYWLSFMARIREYRPVVTLHSVYTHQDKTICEAVIPEVVVHSEAAKKVLRMEKGITAPVKVIAHGCGTVRPNRLYNLYRSNHTFMQFGFGFRYKNWECPIQATAILKSRYPDIFFTGLFSEGLFSKQEHQRYFDELMAMARKLGVLDNISLVRGYQSEQVLDSYLGTNQAAVFAYQSHPEHVVYGASGAARRAIEAGLPVVVSKVPHFADMEGVCPRTDGPEELAAELVKMFESREHWAEQVARQTEYMVNNSWQFAAESYLRICQKA